MRSKSKKTKFICRSSPRLAEYVFKKDPTEIMEADCWIKKAGNGIWTILPQYAVLIRAIESVIIDKIAAPLKFQEAILPRLINLEIAEKKGQLSKNLDELLWVCPSTKNKCYGEAELYRTIPKTKNFRYLIGDPCYVLSHGQCDPFYDIWTDKVLDISKAPIKFFDRNGSSFRQEAGNLKSLERLNEFNRIEFIYLGDEKEVIEIREKIKNKTVKMIDNIFDFDWKLMLRFPEYISPSTTNKNKKDAEFVKTYDLFANLPFKTASRKEKELEIASFYVHGDHFAKCFNWHEKNNKTIWSGCSAIGSTRLAYLLVLRYGLKFSSWPYAIKKRIGNQLAIQEAIVC